MNPHTDKGYNILEYFNEYCLIFLAYIMLFFTNIIPTETINQEQIEICEIIALQVMFIIVWVNVAVMITISIVHVIKYCKNRKAKKK